MSGSSSSSSRGWSRGALAAAIAIPAAALATASLLYLQFAREKQALTATKGRKTKAKKAAAAPTTGSVESSEVVAAANAALAVAAGNGDFRSDQELVEALHADVELRSLSQLPNAKLEQRIWRAIRQIDPHALGKMAQTARTEVAQWIVAYHANASPLLDGGGVGQHGGPAGSGSTKWHRVALDYDLAWALLESVETELGQIEEKERTPEQEELRKATELVLLDLAHKMRRADRILDLYGRVRARNTSLDEHGKLDPQSFTEMEFFTLWMLSPLLGRWSDFFAWSNFMLEKGQSLDEFHHLAVQRPDLIDFRQMFRMVDQAAKEGRIPGVEVELTEQERASITQAGASPVQPPAAAASLPVVQEEPSPAGAEDAAVEPAAAVPTPAAAAASSSGTYIGTPSVPSSLTWRTPLSSELEWGSWDVVGMVWNFVHSSGEDSDAIAKYHSTREPLGVWKSIAPGLVNFRKIGACARAQSMVSVAVPICGPLLRTAAEDAAAAASSSSSDSSFEAQSFHCTGSVHFRADAPMVAGSGLPPRRLLKLVEEYRDFQLLDDLQLIKALKQYRPSEVEKAKSAAAAAGAATEESTGAAAADFATNTSSSSSTTTSSSSSSSSQSGKLTLDEFDPSNPPQLWRGVYIFEQYSVEEQVLKDTTTGRILGTRHVAEKKPFMHVEYEVILKMTRSKVQAHALQ